MASTLSPSAIHRIIFLIENDDRPAGKEKEECANISLPPPWLPPGYPHMPQQVNRKWKAVYKLYMDIKPAPPLDYLNSMELALVVKGEVDDEDVRAIFAHGKPLQFWGCPPLLVSKIVEAFTALQQAPEYIDVTITSLDGLGATRPAEAWPQVYKTHLPCHACTTVETVEARSVHRLRSTGWVRGSVDVAVEKFHISSKNLDRQLTGGLHYQLGHGTPEMKPAHESVIHKVIIRLEHKVCPAQTRLPGTTNRSSATSLLLPDFASEVFGFLDRAHVRSSLLANRGLRDLICQLKQRLPVHHLRCAFEEEREFGCSAWFSGAYWLAIGHFQRDLAYTDVRRFEMPSDAGAENDCALMRHYLGNSYVDIFQAPDKDFPFAIKMLASLATLNFSVGRMELFAEDAPLFDYRSMDAVFGEMRMRDLHLNCGQHRFAKLVKTTDFFRMSTIQRLRKLELTLTKSWTLDKKPRGRATSKSPLWVSGIYLLRNCEHYRVDYRSGRHLRLIERKIVGICEEFERGQISDIVGHFRLETNASQRMNYAFNRDNLVVSRMKVEGEYSYDRINGVEWDVYRFRNAITREYLTACVGRDKREYFSVCFLHILRGEVYPDASFADC